MTQELAPGRPNPGGYPYKIAVLCDLRDRDGRVLLIRRAQNPNLGLYSPIGGKLDMPSGESPGMCARREIREEAGLDLPFERLHLGGIISEHGYEGNTNWLMFWYRAIGPVEVRAGPMREGSLEWHSLEDLKRLPLPRTDREIIWPLVLAHEGGFFAVHIECTGTDFKSTLERSYPAR